MVASSTLTRIRAAFHSALNRGSTKSANKTREWLSQNYDSYPAGVERVYESDSSVKILLSEPLDIDVFASVIESEGFEAEVVEEDGKKILSFHRVNQYSNGRIQRVLAGTFHESRNIPIGRDPIKSEGNVPNDRLGFLLQYLEKSQSKSIVSDCTTK